MCPPSLETYGNWGKVAHSVFYHLASLLSISQSIPKPKIVTDIYGRLNMFFSETCGKGHHGKGVGSWII